MKFEEGRTYKKLGKVTGFLCFAVIFSIILTIISRFTRVPDLTYPMAVLVTCTILLFGYTLKKILE